ncbi:MAG: hypothetical protein PHQ54_00160 [Candidatus Omnitrophica bacterium]|nr:hypothetical protein [Candidatus Omnitrophota bacterium]
MKYKAHALIILLFCCAVNLISSEAKYVGSDLRDPFKSYLPEAKIDKTSSVILRELSTLNLTGIIWGEDPMAIINGKVYRVGESILGIKIVEIDKRGVLLEHQGESYILKPK